MVLDGIVGPALQDLRDLGPLVAESPMVEIQDPLFVLAPGDLLNLRVQMVVPSLPALLADPSWQVLCYLSPLLGAIGFNQVQD